MSAMKVAFATLGCKVNQDETVGIRQLFADAGYEIVDFKDLADVYIVNTCTVTNLGSKKSRQLLRQARRRNPRGLVVAAGCYPQAAAGELADMAEVDLIVGNSHKAELVELVQSALADKERRIVVGDLDAFQDLPVAAGTSRHRATLKIQEGCQRYCTYCIVPKARGPLRSMPLDTVVERGKDLVRAGFREIVLTGINLTSYGKEDPGLPDLADVINALAPAVGSARIRISSVEPTDFSPRLIEAFRRHANVCNDFHIPLQSGSNPVLQRMGRCYSAEDFLALTDQLKQLFPNPSFSTDVIVGFPGESEADFEATKELIKRVGFSRLHVFRYSPRPGTPAAGFEEQIPPAVKAMRSNELIALGQRLAENYARTLLGGTERLLVEEPSPLVNGYAGYGDRYVRIHCTGELVPGQIVDVRITGNKDGELLAVQV